MTVVPGHRGAAAVVVTEDLVLAHALGRVSTAVVVESEARTHGFLRNASTHRLRTESSVHLSSLHRLESRTCPFKLKMRLRGCMNVLPRFLITSSALELFVPLKHGL